MEEAQGLSAVLGEKHSIKSLVIARGFKGMVCSLGGGFAAAVALGPSLLGVPHVICPADSWKSICALGTVLKEVPHLEHLSLAGLLIACPHSLMEKWEAVSPPLLLWFWCCERSFSLFFRCQACGWMDSAWSH